MYQKPTFTKQYLNFNSHHPYDIKKGIIHCLQDRVKAICSDSNAYQDEMKSLRDNLLHNNYPASIISAQRNLDWTGENNTQKLTTVWFPNIKGLAKRIRKICTPYNIRIIFRGGMTLQKYLFWVKLATEYMTKTCIYSIPCSCDKVYKGKTCRPQKVRLEEHWKVVCQRRKIKK